ncbi:glycosyltransferase family 2 protein [Lacticaseibacillus saniviri]|uniref:glycosyltransferase family 2 protein n=1 Tax=Lacticaseibacillus saniviri TaxID=931533 RepID=UPI0006D11F8E|nr:glycosyltransferase [Lacticaseibacillus saniviri]
MPKISVLMAAYNETDEQVNAALASIVAQTETDFELLLVLDNPTNEPLKALLTDWQARDERIKLLINPTNLGLAASLNKGLAAATAPYIARMDADDIAKPERFATQLTLMDAHDFDALSTNAQFIDEAGQVVGEHNWIPETPEGLAQLLPYGSNLIHPSMMLTFSDDGSGWIPGIADC